jgi:hypothetical protein
MTENQALLAAFGFGVLYNWFIGRLHLRYGGDRGYVSLEVVGGVLAVLAIGTLINNPPRFYFIAFGQTVMLSNAQCAAWLYLRLFMAAGVPMVLGSLWRWVSLQGEQ